MTAPLQGHRYPIEQLIAAIHGPMVVASSPP